MEDRPRGTDQRRDGHHGRRTRRHLPRDLRDGQGLHRGAPGSRRLRAARRDRRPPAGDRPHQGALERGDEGALPAADPRRRRPRDRQGHPGGARRLPPLRRLARQARRGGEEGEGLRPTASARPRPRRSPRSKRPSAAPDDVLRAPRSSARRATRRSSTACRSSWSACRNGSSTRASKSSSSSRAATPRARAARSAGSPKRPTRG